MRLRKLRWYEWWQEFFCMSPQWYALKPDGTLTATGWITAKYAAIDAERLGTNTVVWLPPAHLKKAQVLKRTIAK